MLNKTNIHLPEKLRFVESGERYSTYTDRDGKYVYLANGTGERLVFLADLDLNSMWLDWVIAGRHGYPHYDGPSTFTAHVENLLVDPDEFDDISFCDTCSCPTDEDTRHSVENGDYVVCDDCFQQYSWCGSCEEAFHDDTMTSIGEDDRVCRSCFARHCHHCEHCGQAAWDNEGCYNECRDSDDCGCESPKQTFSVRHGDTFVREDERVHVTLPSGVISDEGLCNIAAFLRSAYHNIVVYNPKEFPEQERARLLLILASQIDELDPRWQTKQGNFTKRLSRLAHKQYGLKITPQEMSQIGNIARAQSTPVDMLIEVTRDLNQSPEMFCHEESCWWQSYAASRCALKSNGGFGLRTFGDESNQWPTGRAWVMPLKVDSLNGLAPTFETERPDAFIVFNGYDDLEGYVPARIVSHMAGMTYRKVGLSVPGMYINNDNGYLVAPEEIADQYTDGRLDLDVAIHSNLFHVEQQKELAHA